MYAISPYPAAGVSPPRVPVADHGVADAPEQPESGQPVSEGATTLRIVTDDDAHPLGPAEAEPARRLRPRSLDPHELGFTPQRAVGWLSPFLLLSTGLRTLLAVLFGAYLDKRELQNALPGVVHEQPGTDGVAGVVRQSAVGIRRAGSAGPSRRNGGDHGAEFPRARATRGGGAHQHALSSGLLNRRAGCSSEVGSGW